MPRSCRSLLRLGVVLVVIVQLAIVGGVAGSTPFASGEPLRAGAEPAAAPVSSAVGNPLRQHRRLYVDRASAAANTARQLAAMGRGADAALLRWLAAQPTAIWFAGGAGDAARLQQLLDAAATAHTMPVVVAYNIPHRDCGGYSANGAVSATAYQAWVRSLAQSIARRPIVVILEPDAIAHAVSGCLPASDVAERYSLLRYAVRTLKADPSAAVYLDAGNAGWISSVEKLVGPLHASGSDFADGFSLNVSSFYDTASTIRYGVDLSRLLGGAHFVIDTSRNGNGAAPAQSDGSPSWCNPPGRAIGHIPSTYTGAVVDAYLWIKRPGDSDGACHPGDPPAGQFWTNYALQLVRARSK